MVDVLPGILEQDPARIVEKIALVSPHTPWAHIELLDNTLVPNATCMDGDIFRPLSTSISLEAHLMVANPEKYIRMVADGGFKRIIAHVEAHDPRLFLEQVAYEQLEVGIALDGPTEFEQVEPFLEEIDFVVVMMVEAGFSGGTFLPECVDKIKSIHDYVPDLPIEVDGGITPQTARLVVEAGASRIISGTYLFSNPGNIVSAIDSLKTV